MESHPTASPGDGRVHHRVEGDRPGRRPQRDVQPDGGWVRIPRIYRGGAYWPKPGWQIIVSRVARHARGWTVEFISRFVGSKVVLRESMGYLEFCRLVGVDP